MAKPNISVVFQAFTEKFERKTAKAGKSVDRFGKKMLKIGASLLAVRAIFNKFKESLAQLDKLGKLSDSLDLDPDFLRGLDLAATQTGTSFDTMVKAIQRMSLTVGEARSGISSGTLALKELNLSADDFEGLDIEEQFLKVADSIAAISDPTMQAAAANKFFGRSYKEILNVLEGGSAAIKKFVQEAQELGGPISREDIKRVERANDALDKMSRTWDAIFQQIAIEFAPELEDLAMIMKDLIGSRAGRRYRIGRQGIRCFSCARCKRTGNAGLRTARGERYGRYLCNQHNGRGPYRGIHCCTGNCRGVG